MKTNTRRHFLAQLICSLSIVTLAPRAFAKTSSAALLLAQDYVLGTDTSAFLVSEKLDGVRALWDGSVLRFRSGRMIAAPAWFIAKLPKTPLDGELWLARGQFDVLSGIVRKVAPVDEEWQRVNYVVFELPQGKGAFTERAQRLREVVQACNWPQLQAAEQFKIADEKALQAKLAEVVKLGGEGLVLHKVDAPYVTGRNAMLLKLKPQADAEAIVTAHIAGKGKYAGLLGALKLRTPEGISFKIGTGLSDEQRKNPPAIGSTITYTYRDKTPQGVPRFASFLRVQDAH